MNVKELIDKLKEYPEDKQIYRGDSEYGYVEAIIVEETTVLGENVLTIE